MAAACSPVLCWRVSVILLYTTSELPSSLTDEPRSDSIASYRGTALAPLWTLCGMKHSVSSYLLFLSQALIGLHRNLSFLTRIAWGFWGWFSIFWFFFFHILFWENIAGILWKAERVLSADSVLSPVLLRGHLVTPLLLALQRSQFSFWDLDLPAACPEAPSACRAAEETLALIQSAEPNTVSLNPRYLTIVSEVITTTLSLTSVIAELLFCVTFCSVSFLRYLNWKLPCPPG